MSILHQARTTIASVAADRGIFRILLSLVFMCSMLCAGLVPRQSFGLLLATYAIAFFGYLAVISSCAQWKWWLVIGIAARVILLFTFPNLSDDVYRFFWDGNLIAAGINPYTAIPTVLVSTGGLPPELVSVYPLLNSPDYYTVYPLVCQLFFLSGSSISGGDPIVFSLILKTIFLACECLSLRLLYLILRERGSVQPILIYALNPLIILELVGNLHFEAVMILSLLAMYWYLKKGTVTRSAAALALGIGAKLIPLVVLPFLIRRMPIRRWLLFACIVCGAILLILLPTLHSGVLPGFASSLDLYFRRFEFNAGIYYLLRWLGTSCTGYNAIATIGPALAITAGISMLILAIGERRPWTGNLPRALIIAWSIFLFSSTTVHPWYVSTLVALCALSPMRFPIIWSGVVMLSYVAYRHDPPSEQLWLVALEYLLVCIGVLLDWRRPLNVERR